MSKPKLYHHFLRARITREQRQAIQEYAKRHGLRWGEAVRELIERALEGAHDVLGRGSIDEAIGQRRVIFEVSGDDKAYLGKEIVGKDGERRKITSYEGARPGTFHRANLVKTHRQPAGKGSKGEPQG